MNYSYTCISLMSRALLKPGSNTTDEAHPSFDNLSSVRTSSSNCSDCSSDVSCEKYIKNFSELSTYHF